MENKNLKPDGQASFLFSLALAVTSLLAIFDILFLSLPQKSNNRDVLGEQTQVIKIDYPVLKTDAVSPPVLPEKALYVVDLTSRKVLLSYDADKPILPASITKVATALVSMSYYDPTTVITVGDDVPKVAGHKMELQAGEKITVKDLLYGLLVYSANDAAQTLAENYPGGYQNFISAMNKLAKWLDLSETNFINPIGLDDYLHFSSAKDLTTLAEYAIKNSMFSTIISTRDYVASSVDGKIVHKMTNLNELLGTVPGVIGVKTGYTEESGESLITLIDHDGHTVLISLIGGSDRFGETKKIIDWIFANYTWGKS